MSVLIAGSVAIDDIATPETQRQGLLGGSASFAGIAASLFGPVHLIGIVGDDFPPAFRSLLKGHKIDLEGLQTAAGKTFRWSGQYEQNMNNRRTLSVELNVFQDFSPQLPAARRNTPYVLLANIAPALQHTVLDQMERPRFVIADTMDLWIETARQELLRLLGRIDLLILNDSEARMLTGKHNLVQAAEWLREKGPRYAAIKKGEHGCLLFGPDEVFSAPALPLREIVDPTGAGDTFAGGLAGCLASTDDVSRDALRRAVIEGTVLASFTCEQFGVEGLTSVTPETWEERRMDIRNLSRF